MEIRKQDFYDKFKCIADKCESTCCTGWQIMVDEDSLLKYRDYTGPSTLPIQNNVDFSEGCIKNKENGDCSFLNKNGLCNLIIDAGENMLCDTCRLYPRHLEEFEDVREWSMSMSCPEIARMMVELKKLHSIEVINNDEPDPLLSDFDDFDLILFDKLNEARETMFSLLDDKTLTLKQKLGLVLKLSEELQILYDEGETFFMEDKIREFLDPSVIDKMKDEEEISFAGFVKNEGSVLNELEVLNNDWIKIISRLDAYDAIKGDDSCSRIEGFTDADYGLTLLNIFKALIFTYFLGSVYNGMIYAYTNMCVFAVSLLDALASVRKDGRMVSKEEFIKLLYMYSKETEHSDENIGILLEYFDL